MEKTLAAPFAPRGLQVNVSEHFYGTWMNSSCLESCTVTAFVLDLEAFKTPSNPGSGPVALTPPIPNPAPNLCDTENVGVHQSIDS